MKIITRKDVNKLKTDPVSYALMMDNCEIESVIVAFVTVLNKRKPYRGDRY